ncbi:anaerobic dehydrogenase, typically selenocysteine-containing [Sulfurospirillum barnesii SES-3]|uniref:Anaerobic dehydrogenase, typically selenocysteine-containing n=2 Tax=Sulfurospirillum barnesii TaxID=44674 RepID=I3XUI7_SULBS|nr:anaerobic dehydrogenase, typically selenocysteine-containing [Sulfurospirillum barnesii SES-3]
MLMNEPRRNFLKCASVSALIPGSLGAVGTNFLKGEDTSIRSVCEMCSSRCAMEARVINGKVVSLQGNAYDKAMGTSLCARGVAGISQLYDEQRLTQPLIRVGKRGENKWRVATWEEALDYIATKLKDLKKNYGAKSVIFSSKTGESYAMLRSFAYTFGSPNVFSHWSSCPIAIHTAFEHTFGETLERDFENAHYILNFGHNLFEGLDIPLTKAMARFASNPSKKLVVFDPRFSLIASKANEWYPIKAGSDLAFVLALLHVWIRDGKYDKNFVQEYTLGFEQLAKALKESTPQWQESLTGIGAHVVERIADEMYQAAPRCIIDWGHKATTSPAEYQRSRAIVIANILMGNVERRGGIYFVKDAKRINALAKESLVPTLDEAYPRVFPHEERLEGAGQGGKYRFVSKEHGVLQAIPEAILAQNPYPIKGWFLTRHNPLITLAHPQKTKEAMEALELIVVNDIYLSDTAMMADVVLPEATYLERDEGIRERSDKVPSYTMRNRAIPAMHGAKTLLECLQYLSQKMALQTPSFWETIAKLRVHQAKGNEALLALLLKRGVATFGIPELFMREPLDVENFVERYPKSKVFLTQRGCLSHFFHALETPSGKIEIFSEAIEKIFEGYGLPRGVDMDVTQGYPYVLISGKSAIHTNGHTHNIPYLHQLMPDNPVWMHPKTAKAHGLKAGDRFYVENGISKEKATAFITEGIRPDTLFAYMGFGRDAPALKRTHGKGLNPSKLLSLQSAPVCGAMITNVGVKITKA